MHRLPKTPWGLVVRSLSLALASSLLQVPEAQASIYRKLFLASSKTPQQRVRIFTQSYRFSPKAISDVYVGVDGVWTQFVGLSTKTGQIKFNLNDRNKRLEFSSFESSPILNVTAYREVEVTRIVEGRSWAPEFGAAVIPDANSRTGWVNAIYQAPRDGRIVYNRVTERQLQQHQTQGFFLIEPHNPYARGGNSGLEAERTLDISLAHKVEREVVVPGSTEWVAPGRLQSDFVTKPVNERLARTRLHAASGRFVFSEVQQVSGDRAMLLVVRDTNKEKLIGEVHEVSFGRDSISVNQRPVKNSRVYIDRDVFGLDLPEVRNTGAARGRHLIEE